MNANQLLESPVTPTPEAAKSGGTVTVIAERLKKINKIVIHEVDIKKTIPDFEIRPVLKMDFNPRRRV